MSERLRTPAMAPPPIRPATPRADNPTAELEAHYQAVAGRMADLPFYNPQLAVAAVGFVQHQGDWLGVMITPWFLNLFLLAGGETTHGQLWGDIPAGERRYLELPCGALQFIADDDPDLGPYQYCPLIAPVSNVPDQATALRTAAEAMRAVFTVPPVVESPVVPSLEPPPEAKPAAPVSRRGFLRRLAGR